MKIHIAIPGGVGMALKQTLSLGGKYAFDHPDPMTADVVIMGSLEDAVKRYTHHQFFILISANQPKKPTPENMVWINVTSALLTISQLGLWEEKIGEGVWHGLEMGKMYLPRNGFTAASRKILVVDDTIANLALAATQLGDHHALTFALGLGAAWELIECEQYDVVLCDCNMPMGGVGGSLSSDAVDIARTVPCGPYLIFPATKSGADVAIVTDANHHQDWTSALCDSLREPQGVNGRKVRFMNHIGKNWAEALGILGAPLPVEGRWSQVRQVFTQDDLAHAALRSGEVDIAIRDSGNTGVTVFYLLGGKEVPEALRRLPGFRPAGVSGVPEPMVSHYICNRTTNEVMLALS